MQVSAIRNRVADVDPDTKANGSIWRLISVEDRHLLLHLNGTSHRPVDAVEHNEQGVTPSLDDPATMLLYRPVYQVAAQGSQPLQSSSVIQSNEAAITNHIGIDDGDKLPPIWRLTYEV